LSNTKKSPQGSNLDLALSIVAAGYFVFPCWEIQGPNSKQTIKSPRTPHGFKDASKDTEKIVRWWKAFPNALVGIPCSINGFWALDLDRKNEVDGVAEFNRLAKGREKPKVGPKQKTLSGGRHMLFKLNGRKVSQNAGKIAPGVDIRSEGYICSGVTPDGSAYSWLRGHGISKPLLSAPDWLMDLVTNPNAITPRETTNNPLVIKKFTRKQEHPEGTRSDGLIRYMGSLKSQGYSDDEAQKLVQTENLERCKPPLTQDELECTIFKSGKKYIQGPRNLFPSAPDPSDMAMAERFVRIHKDKAKYFAAQKKWLIWDGKRWRPDDINQVYILAGDVSNEIHKEANAAENEYERKLLTSCWLQSKNTNRIKRYLVQAGAYLAVRARDLDNSKELLNVANGTVDMKTGTLVAHDPSKLITKLMDVNFEPMTKCPKWKEFIKKQVPNTNVREFLQRCIGYSLSGRGIERLVPFIYGTKGTGKSTFLETIKKLGGDYVTSTDVDLVMRSRRDAGGENASPRRAALRGARLVLTDEMPIDAKLDEGRFKSLSGGDTISARGVYKEPEEFEATHCLFLVGNNLPQFRDQSGATAERFGIIGFDQEIALNERKPRDIVMGGFIEEGPGILNWIIKGYQDYVVQGLNEPAEVTSARGTLEAEQDAIGRFFSEECEFDKKYSIESINLYGQFLVWCADNNEESGTKVKLTRSVVRTAGCTRDRGRLHGIRLIGRQPK
jgi:putative DNA primase/helicase